jgi:hypothetical protein
LLGVGDLNMKSYRPIGYGEGDEEALDEWLHKDKSRPRKEFVKSDNYQIVLEKYYSKGYNKPRQTNSVILISLITILSLSILYTVAILFTNFLTQP